MKIIHLSWRYFFMPQKKYKQLPLSGHCSDDLCLLARRMFYTLHSHIGSQKKFYHSYCQHKRKCQPNKMKKSSVTPCTDKKHGGGYEEFYQIKPI